MPDYFQILREYYEFYPLVAFVSLLLAGCNIPISEDLVIITGALLCHGRSANMIYTLIAIYAGVIISDFFMYWVGTMVRKGSLKAKLLSHVVPEPAAIDQGSASGKLMEKMHHYLDRYGIFTFIIGRFIPFGVRNTLFFSSGFFNLRLRDFALYDIIAAAISVNTLFFVAYYFGDDAKKPIRIAGIVLFILAVSGVIGIIIRLVILWNRKRRQPQ